MKPISSISKRLSVLLLFVAQSLCHLRVAATQEASPPEGMTYQGYLTDSNGNPLDSTTPGTHEIVFRIYNDQANADSSNLVWSETQTVVVSRGQFSVVLGSGRPTPNETAQHTSLSSAFLVPGSTDTSVLRYLDITVTVTGTNQVHILPRLQLVTAPFAFLSKSARQLVDSTGQPVLSASSQGNITFGQYPLIIPKDISVQGNLSVAGLSTVGSLSANNISTVSDLNVGGNLSVRGWSAISSIISAYRQGISMTVDGINGYDGPLITDAFTPFASNGPWPGVGRWGLFMDHRSSAVNPELYLGVPGTDYGAAKIGLGGWTTNGTREDWMTLDNGKVGIGQTNPLYALDVKGTINASGVSVYGSPLPRFENFSANAITATFENYNNPVSWNLNVMTPDGTAVSYQVGFGGVDRASGVPTLAFTIPYSKPFTNIPNVIISPIVENAANIGGDVYAPSLFLQNITTTNVQVFTSVSFRGPTIGIGTSSYYGVKILVVGN